MCHTSIWIYLKNHLSLWTANGSQGHKHGGRRKRRSAWRDTCVKPKWHCAVNECSAFPFYQSLQYSASALIEGHLSLTESVDASTSVKKKPFQLENLYSKETPTSRTPYYQPYKNTSNFQQNRNAFSVFKKVTIEEISLQMNERFSEPVTYWHVMYRIIRKRVSAPQKKKKELWQLFCLFYLKIH